jgi:hypothetical protein
LQTFPLAAKGSWFREEEEIMEERAESVRREFGERAEREAGRAVRNAREKLSGAYERTSEVAGRAYQDALESARENPGMSALVCFGVGVTVGLWLAGMSRPRGFRDRVLPVLATAMADAVREIADTRR